MDILGVGGTADILVGIIVSVAEDRRRSPFEKFCKLCVSCWAVTEIGLCTLSGGIGGFSRVRLISCNLTHTPTQHTHATHATYAAAIRLTDRIGAGRCVSSSVPAGASLVVGVGVGPLVVVETDMTTTAAITGAFASAAAFAFALF